MSAVRGDEAASPAALRPMRDGDLDAVVAIEATILVGLVASHP